MKTELGKRRLIRVDVRRLDWDGLQGAFSSDITWVQVSLHCNFVVAANIVIFARKATPQTAQAK